MKSLSLMYPHLHSAVHTPSQQSMLLMFDTHLALTMISSVLWSGTPVVTWPRHPHKMCSCVGASIAGATGFGKSMIVHSADEYVERAVDLAHSLGEPDGGELRALRKSIFLARDYMPLFDTRRWVRNFERGLREAWRRWVEGTEFEGTDEWYAPGAERERESGCIYVQDEDATVVVGAG
jgi:protein O-GlcNAc transferase